MTNTSTEGRPKQESPRLWLVEELRPVPFDCACLHPTVNGTSLDGLRAVRERCVVLRDVLVPDADWAAFESWHLQGDPHAAHASALLVALKRGHLARITLPIHECLCEGDHLREHVKRQYTRDLREDWMYYHTPEDRHLHWRMFQGRLTELQFASWLRVNGEDVVSLEAWGGSNDVQTVRNGVHTAYEVKLIGTDTEDFQRIVRSMGAGPAAFVVSAYSGVNYLLVRLYEAAKQLADTPATNRVGVAVVDAVGWDIGFEMQLEGRWIDWRRPRFLGENPHNDLFLISQVRRFPNLFSDLGQVLSTLTEVWIFRTASHVLERRYAEPQIGREA